MKKVISILLILVMLVGLVAPAGAGEIEDCILEEYVILKEGMGVESVTIVDIPQEIIEAEHQRQVDEYLNALFRGSRMEQRPPTTTVLQRTTRIQRNLGRAGGQLRDGTVFPNTTSGFTWQDGGNNVSISFTLGWGPASFSISAGNAFGSTGTFVGTTVANVAVVLHVSRAIEVREYHVYRGGGLYRRFATATPVQNQFSIVRVWWRENERRENPLVFHSQLGGVP